MPKRSQKVVNHCSLVIVIGAIISSRSVQDIRLLTSEFVLSSADERNPRLSVTRSMQGNQHDHDEVMRISLLRE
jgi:hypothetical protein